MIITIIIIIDIEDQKISVGNSAEYNLWIAGSRINVDGVILTRGFKNLSL